MFICTLWPVTPGDNLVGECATELSIGKISLVQSYAEKYRVCCCLECAALIRMSNATYKIFYLVTYSYCTFKPYYTCA